MAAFRLKKHLLRRRQAERTSFLNDTEEVLMSSTCHQLIVTDKQSRVHKHSKISFLLPSSYSIENSHRLQTRTPSSVGTGRILCRRYHCRNAEHLMSCSLCVSDKKLVAAGGLITMRGIGDWRQGTSSTVRSADTRTRLVSMFSRKMLPRKDRVLTTRHCGRGTRVNLAMGQPLEIYINERANVLSEVCPDIA